MTPEQSVLDLLMENARYTNADIARMTDLTESEVYDAIADLEDQGVIRGYRAVVDWRRADRERVRAEVEVDVTLDRETSYGDVAERLVAFDEVTALRLISGDYDFDMEVEAETIREVSAFVAEEVAPLPEVDGTVTHLIMDSYKEGGIEFDDDDEDDRLSVSP
jgi:DNA-binding Lrp family transcriptional regulator